VTLLEQMMLGTHVALQVLGARLVLLVTLAMTCGLFCWAMYLQTQYGIIIAAAWAVSVFLPVLIRGERHASPKHPAAHESPSIPTGATASQPRRRAGGNSMEIGRDPRAPETQRELDV
jgi:hypothetical protein